MWVLEYIGYRRSGRLSRPYDEYHPKVLAVLWNELEGAVKRLEARRQREEERRARERAMSVEPRVTGDDVVDQWERDIAEGRMPDFTQGRRQ